jgi:large subunit ribosomal protein L6
MINELSIPEGVSIKIDNKTVKVSGPKGELTKTFKHFHDIKMKEKDGKFFVESPSGRQKTKAMMGTIVAHVRNMVKGVTEGYTYHMKVIYSHFPVTVKVEGDKVIISNFLGENVPRVARIMGDTKIEIKGQEITVTGIDKDDVGQTCGNIEQAGRITKFDRRVFQDGIYIVEKG